MIKYKSGYKYQLHEDYRTKIEIRHDRNIRTEYINLTVAGTLTVKKGYAWDGPSGPTFDTKNFMRGSLVHDALYQLMRMEKLPLGWREQADYELDRICKEDGMSAVRRWWVLRGVRIGGRDSTLPENAKEILTAP